MLMYPLVPGTDYPKYFNPYIVNIISEIADGTSVFLLLGWVPLGSPLCRSLDLSGKKDAALGVLLCDLPDIIWPIACRWK